jgi:hypothetical protein
LVEFFEVISFFGVAAFFAWLAYAPLQGQAMVNTTKDQEKAKRNLSIITEYFLISFILFAISAISDYVSHRPQFAFGQEGLLRFNAADTFALGSLALFLPILYIRVIGRSGRDFADINPPYPATV